MEGSRVCPQGGAEWHLEGRVAVAAERLIPKGVGVLLHLRRHRAVLAEKHVGLPDDRQDGLVLGALAVADRRTAGGRGVVVELARPRRDDPVGADCAQGIVTRRHR